MKAVCRNEILRLGVLTLVGAGVRVLDLGAQSLWLDELFSVFLAQREWGQVIGGTAQGDTNPPLFNLFLHIALQFGSDEIAARSVSVLFGVATIPLFYFFARQLFDARVAVLATLVLAFNPFHVLFAQEARMYALLAFLTLASFVFFLRAWRDNRTRDWLGFALLQTLAFYTHSLAFLNLLALDVFAVTQRTRRRGRGLLAAHLIVGMLFTPWLFVMMQQVARVQSGFWGAPPSPLVLATTPYLFLFSNTTPILLVPIGLFAALTIIAWVALAARRAESNAALALWFAACVALVPLVTLFAISLARPMFVERTLIASSFGWYLVVAWGVLNAPPRILNRILGAVGLVVMLASLTNYFFNPEMHKPPFRDAARVLVAQFQEGDGVVHTSDSSALAFMYYAPQLPNYFLAGDPDYMNETTRGRSGRIAGLVPRALDDVVAGHARVWLVVALDHNAEYQRARVQEFDTRYHREEILEVGKIAFVRYEVRR